MKKWICIILAVLLAAGCAGGLAEGASSSDEMKILLVKEDVTASVYDEPGGTAIDQLAGGTLCCAVGDPVKAGDVEYLLVFYLDSEKKGALGYIDAEDAQLLTEEELKALLQDPEKMNALLDLVDAMNDLLMPQDGDTTGETGSGTSGSRKNAPAETIPLLRQLYDQLTGALSRLFSFDLSEIAGNVADAAKTAVKDAAEVIAEKFNEAKKTVEENWPAVEKKAGEILDAAREKADELLPEVQEKAADIVDGVKKKYDAFSEDPDAFLEDLKKDVTEKLEELDAASGNAAGSLLDKVAGLSNELEDLVNSDTFTLVKNAIPAFAENYREQGFTKGTEALVNTIDLAMKLMNQSSSGDK